MKKMILFMAMGVLVCWLPGQALAQSSSFVSTFNISANGTVTAPDSTFGTVVVDLNSTGNVATITITPNESPGPDLDILAPGTSSGGSTLDGALNVVNPGGLAASVVSASNGSAYAVAYSSLQSFHDTQGLFNVLINGWDGGSEGMDNVVLTLTTTGTWSNASNVLTTVGNGELYDASLWIYSEGATSAGLGTSDSTYISEEVTPAVPLPPTVLLLSSGLLGLLGLGWRKRTIFNS